jgi:DNA polymerase-3 subunit alpha
VVLRITRTRPRLTILRGGADALTAKGHDPTGFESPTPTGFWSVHTHSRYSTNDALPQVKDMVARAVELNQPALGLTDHGNMAGSVELYQSCMKAGIKPFPGSEMYFVPDLAQYRLDYANKHKKAERYHMGVVAYSEEGYRNLVNLSTLSHQNFFHKPTIEYSLLAQLAEDGRTAGLAVTTGCYFGYAIQSLIHRGPEATTSYLATLNSWFPDSVYVEIQNHNIEHDTDLTDDLVADEMVKIADEMGLPVVITQDAHYLREEDKTSHESLKRLVAFGPDADDAVFPGDGFHMADDRWIADHHGPSRLARGLEGLGDLLGRHTLRIPVLDSYAYSVPRVVAEPQRAMQHRCDAALREKFKAVPKRYLDQLREEYEVIAAADMAGYMMLVAMVTDYMREHEILFQTRGSAAGSLVSWLLGISSEDPIKWDLRFERFLSKDRTKPPDIDLDIAHDKREQVIGWLNTKFTARQIGSWALYSLEADEDADAEDNRGSLRVRYFSTMKQRRGDEAPVDWMDVPPGDREMLHDLSDRKLFKGMGTNAAGVVLTSTREEFDALVPLAYMPRAGEKSGFVTQYAKDDIEALGLVKLDVLGSKTLTVMQRTMANLGLSVDELTSIEYRDTPTYALLRSGMTEGIFQMEGGATKWGCKDLKPNHIKDVIAAMALFRPAAMNSGGTKAYIKRKHKDQPVPERHELLAKVTQATYGVLLYQEQVIDMLRGLGMGADDLTAFLKAVKASNKDIGNAGEVIASYQRWINEQCVRLGMSEEDVEFLDEAIAGFAAYGFNRAHATIYGITAYRCAYLVAHHPLEFHGALLSVAAGSKKEAGYLRATRKRGVRITNPHVNVSGDTYTVDKERNAIRKGLVSVKGVGEKAAAVIASLAPFHNLDDLVERSPARPVSGGKNYDGSAESFNGVLAALRDAGALSGL